jgi:hypothetical protein
MQRIDPSWLIGTFALSSSLDLDLDLNVLKKIMRIATCLVEVVNYIEKAAGGVLR